MLHASSTIFFLSNLSTHLFKPPSPSYRTRTSALPANSLDESIWSVALNAQTGEGPFQIKVTQPLPNETLVTIMLGDVLFGDVWICSGQSNMQFLVQFMFNASIEIANAGQYSKVRLFTVAQN
jgi:sialate O-acetylesterase